MRESPIVAPFRRVALRTLPEDWLGQRRVRRRGDLFRKAGAVFVHVPRTAGASLSRAAYGRFLGHFSIRQLLEAASDDVLALPRFAVARNPWDRAVSAYEFARAGVGREGQIRMAFPELYRGPEFESFERFVESFLAEQDLEQIDGVFRPQCHYLLTGDGTMPFDHVGRFENLAATVSWLSERLGRKLELRRVSSSQHVGYRHYYTPALRDRVATLYRADVELLEYDF